MRVLAITKIFPNSLEPTSSPFNRQQFTELAKLCDLTVLEAIPYFPGAETTGQPPRAAKLALLPRSERISGIETVYMRTAYMPVVGLGFAGPLYLASLMPYLEMASRFDVILGTWAYPDGCAAVAFAKMLRKPCVVKVHGSDINVLGKLRGANRFMAICLPRADALVAVSTPLVQGLLWKGCDAAKIKLVPNGVNAELFYPRDRGEARTKLGVPLDRPLALYVGRLEETKGVGDLLEAFADLREKKPGVMLALVGADLMPERIAAARAAFGDALITPGIVTHEGIADWMAACDVFTLPSWAEGTPNVILEALASGRPPVGTRVGGIPDIIEDGKNGILARSKDPRGLVYSILSAFARKWDPEALRATAPGSWSDSASKLYDVLEGAARAHAS